MQNLTGLFSRAHELEGSLGATKSSVDLFYVQVNAVVVFMMQCGFAFLEAGAIDSKSVTNILMKNFIDAMVGGVVWYLYGFSFAFGNTEGSLSFIGSKYFAFSSMSPSDHAVLRTDWFFQFTFAATATTIISGALAGRCRFTCYVLWSIYCTSWVYPVVAHWVWSSSGWLSAFAPEALRVVGTIDFSGSGVIHTLAGVCSLVGAYIIGPRVGRFDPDWDGDRPGTLRTFRSLWSGLGTFLLWFGWYGFNAGSSLKAIHNADVNALTSINTTIGACAGALTAMLIQFALKGNWDLVKLLNGLLAGLVAITGGCSTLPPWGSLITGACAGAIYYGLVKLLFKARIDDPVDATAVHLGNGIWGMVAIGLLADETNVARAYPGHATGYGLFMGGGGKLLGAQLLTVVVVVVWSFVMSAAFFVVTNMLGFLRVHIDVERAGLDMEHIEMTEEQKKELQQGLFKYDKKLHSSHSRNTHSAAQPHTVTAGPEVSIQ